MTEVQASGRHIRDDSGFTVLELLISVAILMTVSALVMQGTIDMSRLSTKQANQSEMHAGIRNATALLQQEVGQAGRMAFPVSPTLLSAVGASGPQWQAVTPAAIPGMFVGLRLVVDTGAAEEIVTVTAVDTVNGRIQANFMSPHAAGAPLRPAGGFAEGIVPTTNPNGSTASVLKIVGDINDDGNLVYVEYTCDWVAGRLYRNMMPYNAATKPATLNIQHVLLENLMPNPANPDGTVAPCFTYEQRTVNGITYVINVAIMTTVRTHDRDPITGQFQTVTKALLNVAPRNIFHVWQIASLGYEGRIQPLPPSVLELIK